MCGPIIFSRPPIRRPESEFAVLIEARGGLEIGQSGDLAVDRCKVGTSSLEQLLEVMDDEIELLEIVDPIARPHYPPQIKPQPARPWVIEAVDRFAGRGQYPGPVNAQTLLRRDQPELDGVPIEPGQALQMPEPERLQPAFAIGLQVVGEDRVHQQRHMAADVVEHVRFLDVVELVAAADEAGRREAAASGMSEENVVRDEPGHRHDLPAGGAVENIAEPSKIRNPVRRHPEPAEPVEIFAAGAPDQQPLLPLKQQSPDRVFLFAIGLPVLLDCKIRPDGCHRPLQSCTHQVWMPEWCVNRPPLGYAGVAIGLAKQSSTVRPNRVTSSVSSRASRAKYGFRR